MLAIPFCAQVWSGWCFLATCGYEMLLSNESELIRDEKKSSVGMEMLDHIDAKCTTLHFEVVKSKGSIAD